MNLLNKLRHYYGPCRVTVSGDVALMPARQHLRYELTGAKRQAVMDWMAALGRQYPFFKAEINDGISEVEIRFFTFKSGCADREFLVHFCRDLTDLAKLLSGDDTLSVIMNFSGIVYDGADAKHFRVLNKQDAVQYTITKTVRRSFYERVTQSAYIRMVLTAILIAVAAAYIWDHAGAVAEPVGQLA
jgi:hypothetical protein